jgi:hypothetical protein
MRKLMIIALSSALVLILALPTFSAIDMKNALGIWKMDEGSGKIVKDSSGAGNDGEITGNAKWVDGGKDGKALEFSGGYVKVPHKEELNLETFTMTGWLKVPAVVAPYQTFMSKEIYPKRNYSIWLLPDKANVGTAVPADSQIASSAVVVDGKWHHVAATYDKKNLKIFVDGEPSGQIALTGTLSTCDAPFTIGAQPEGGGPLQGIIDEVSLFKVALADEDIKRIYTDGLKSLVSPVESNGKLAVTWGAIRSK